MNGIACLATGGNLHEKFSISSHRMGIGSRMEKNRVPIFRNRGLIFREGITFFFFFDNSSKISNISIYYSLSLCLFLYIYTRTMKIF